MSTATSSSYISHINGLRAVAILGILVYHLRASYCPAGYFGVDLFLVISGFLLLRELFRPGAEREFHYGSYLLKKAWRIIPSWFVVTVVVCALTAYLLPPSRVGDIFKTARYSSMFRADFFIDRSGSYFNVFSQQNPLLHFWYLSVTQQLYIVAPLLVIPLARWCSRRAALILLSVLALLSFVFYLLTASSLFPPGTVQEPLLHAVGAKTAYYHLIPRFWEVVAGGLIFLLPELSEHPRLRAWLGALGLVGILVSFFLYATGSSAIYLTVICSLLALRYASTGWAAKVLNCKPLQAIGSISFSLYLWHWPIMMFWKYCSFDSPGPVAELLMVAFSLLMGAFCWRFIERLRMPSLSGVKGTVLRCLLLLLLPIVSISATQLHKGIKQNMVLGTDLVSDLPWPPQETEPAVLKGMEFLAERGLNQPLRLGGGEAGPSFLLMGDSHAGQIHQQLNAACLREGVRGLHLNNSVVPFWNLTHYSTPHDPGMWDEKMAKSLLAYLAQQPGIRYVIIALRWEFRFRSLTCADWRDGQPINDEWKRMEITGPGLGELCDRIRALGKQVIILGDNPNFDAPYPLDEWERYQQQALLRYIRPYRERILSVERHKEMQSFSHKIHHQLAKEGRIIYIDMAEGMMENGAYPARQNGQFLYRDDNHFTPLGAQRAVDFLMPRLLQILRQDAPPAPSVKPGE